MLLLNILLASQIAMIHVVIQDKFHADLVALLFNGHVQTSWFCRFFQLDSVQASWINKEGNYFGIFDLQLSPKDTCKRQN